MSCPVAGTGHNDVAGQDVETALDVTGIGTFQRVLLTTDGTVVHLLESFFEEPIRTDDVVQEATSADSPHEDLALRGGETILSRRAVLQGTRSGRNYVYAEATLVLKRVPEPVRRGLLETGEPIGRLLMQERVETFRELLEWGSVRAEALAKVFGSAEDDYVLFRSYRIFRQGLPMMLITEYFPPTYLRRHEQSRPRENRKGQGRFG